MLLLLYSTSFPALKTDLKRECSVGSEFQCTVYVKCYCMFSNKQGRMAPEREMGCSPWELSYVEMEGR